MDYPPSTLRWTVQNPIPLCGLVDSGLYVNADVDHYTTLHAIITYLGRIICTLQKLVTFRQDFLPKRIEHGPKILLPLRIRDHAFHQCWCRNLVLKTHKTVKMLTNLNKLINVGVYFNSSGLNQTQVVKNVCI